MLVARNVCQQMSGKGFGWRGRRLKTFECEYTVELRPVTNLACQTGSIHVSVIGN